MPTVLASKGAHVILAVAVAVVAVLGVVLLTGCSSSKSKPKTASTLTPPTDTAPRKIGFVNVLGYRGAAGSLFANSSIAAGTIGTVWLKDMDLTNGGEPFGLAAAHRLTNLTLRQGRYTYYYPSRWPADAGDLTIRII